MGSSRHSDSFANRDAPVPVVQVHAADDSTPTLDPRSHARTPSAESAAIHRISASKLKDKLESLGDNLGKHESPGKMGDRMFNLLLSQILPSEHVDDPSPPQDSSTMPQIKDRRSRAYVARPGFSIPTMSSNFRRFNSRIGVVFVGQNVLIRLFTWTVPTQTLAFLFMYTFVCIDPYLLPVLPLAGCLFFIMVPSYLTRHPPPPTSLPTDLYPLGGPPLADAHTIKPTPEFSKDFFRNMRDLQNCMDDFSRAHDAIISVVTPLTNFSNENLSTLLYIGLLFTSCLLFITAHLLPWRAILLLAGYTLVALGHPAVQDLIASPQSEHAIEVTKTEVRTTALLASQADIQLSTSQEMREVEMFELQHRPLHDESGEYEPYIFSHSSYAPLSPARIGGDRPRGTPFFEDVLPPRGWRWADKKWTLDLLSREWVDDRCVTGVEVEIEGERWVTDLHYEILEDDERDVRTRVRASSSIKGSRDVAEDEREVLRRAWESHAPSRKGEWRRRRWVRMVERMPVR